MVETQTKATTPLAVSSRPTLAKMSSSMNPDAMIEQKTDLDSRALFDSKIAIYEQKYSESQEGFLWSTGHKNLDNSKKTFGLHTWDLVDFNKQEMTIDLGTTIPTSNGKLDEKNTMWFEVENKYLRVHLKALWQQIHS